MSETDGLPVFFVMAASRVQHVCIIYALIVNDFKGKLLREGSGKNTYYVRLK